MTEDKNLPRKINSVTKSPIHLASNNSAENKAEQNLNSNEESGLTKSENSALINYIRQVQKFPLLTPEEEYEHGIKYAEQGDKESAKILTQSHLRLVVKMAGKFRNYGLPLIDLIAEGNLGLIQAVKKFDPRKGFRLSTYAMWWIKAYMQDYILRSWSLVKIGTTAAQKKLFFNLNKIKKRLGGMDGDFASKNQLTPAQVKHIAESLHVSEKDVISMDSRLTQSDTSLNKAVGDEDDAKEMVDLMASEEESQEEIAIHNQEKLQREELFQNAFNKLNEREKDILIKRQMSEESMTLEDLSQIYKVSRERIRQIEENAIRKIKKEIASLEDAKTKK
jgi:RNA polymerase sigma-32 factor